MSALPVAATGVLDVPNLRCWQRGGTCIVQYGVGTAHVQLPALTPRELRALRQRAAERTIRVAVSTRRPASTPDTKQRRSNGRDLASRIRAAYDRPDAGRGARGVAVE
jgi:hypothetical protein